MRIKSELKNLLLVLLIFLLVMLAAFVFDEIGLRAENIFLIFLLGVIIAIIETKRFWWGLGLGFVLVFAFNFFFTEPIYTFMINDANYYVSFAIFIAVAIIANTLTARLQKQIDISEQSRLITSTLYKTANGFINLSGTEEICAYAQGCLSDILSRSVTVTFGVPEGTAAKYCYDSSFPCGFGETNFTGDTNKYMPLKSRSDTLGVVTLDCRSGDISDSGRQLCETVISQTVIALQRELLRLSEEESRIRIEKEKLKSNLLRSISHDLRTPLTSISGGADFLLSTLDGIEKETLTSVLKDIQSDSLWLSRMVENLLNMTRIQDGRLTINKKKEVVDDIIGEVTAKVGKRKGSHGFITEKPEAVILCPMDGQLIIQVLINLVDNAFKHTKENCAVKIRAFEDERNVIFEVSDDGGGIPEEHIGEIFNSFYSAQSDSPDKKRGMGLGLSICKSIVEAHGGVITAENNGIGGATFRFTLPKEDKTDVR